YICPNGIPNLRKGEFEARRKNEVPYLLFLSNLLINKGVFVLLDALRILKEKGYLFNCQYVGGETAEINAVQFSEEVDKRDLNDRVAYVGRKVGEEKNAFFQQADVFVFPTYYYNECFPLVILEAMEYKLPAISTNEGGIPDMVKDGENGLICEKQNPYLLADCIAKLLDDEELRVKMGNAGYDKFCREFTLQQFEHRMLDILSQNLPQKEKEN
ncbi:glycosyltransferase family 4 protein, partial [Phocaeicola vulgatus]